MSRMLSLIVLIFVFTPSLAAQSLSIVNARIIDGNGEVIEGANVAVLNGRIVSILRGTGLGVPAGPTIDAEGMTLMPGFIDTHRHLMEGNPDEWLQTRAVASMREFLAAGFTTILSAGDGLEPVLELRRRLEAGEITGPRLLVTGRVPVSRGGGFRGGVDPARLDNSRPPNRPTEPAGAVPREETIETVRALAEAGVDAIKTNITVTPGGPETETLALIAREAARYGVPTITHAVTVQDTVAAVEAGVTVLVHTPHIGQLDEATAKMIAGRGIPMMSTLGVFVPAFGEDNAPLFRDLGPFPFATLASAGQGPVNARLLWEAGITYGYGTDTRFPPRDALAHELRPLALVFSPEDIVTILTRNAASTIGLGDDIGTIETGKLADMVLVDGDPLGNVSDLLNVKVVIRGGEVVIDNR